jgi:RNA polymerase sigma factor (sigma-70 family)
MRQTPDDQKRDEMERLVQPVVPALRRYALVLTRDATAADDLVQDCLERVFRRWHLRREDLEIRPWLFSILHNLAVSSMRRMARRGLHLPLESLESALPGQRPQQEDRLHQTDVMAALAQLPEDQRSVLLLVALEQFTYAEAAHTLDIPIGTVMSRLARGRERLRTLLARDVKPPVATIRVVK